jgi:hypothetical protein
MSGAVKILLDVLPEARDDAIRELLEIVAR